jgi:hypothetical protein
LSCFYTESFCLFTVQCCPQLLKRDGGQLANRLKWSAIALSSSFSDGRSLPVSWLCVLAIY